MAPVDTRGEASCQAAEGGPQGMAADCYQRAKRCVAVAVAKAKMWEELSEATEQDHQSAPKMFWQTIRCLGGGNLLILFTVEPGNC